jgi:16S rRNA (uracil1498-N3)-methyltransferase
VQGIPRLTKADLITQKLTEVGAAAVVFVPMEYTPYTDAFERISKRLERLRRIAEAAAKQCCRFDIPSVDACANLSASLKRLEPDTKLLYADNMTASAKSVRDCLRDMGNDSRLAVVIGPEGGFSSQEREVLERKGAEPFSLGGNILRTETAAIVATAIILYERGNA